MARLLMGIHADEQFTIDAIRIICVLFGGLFIGLLTRYLTWMSRERVKYFHTLPRETQRQIREYSGRLLLAISTMGLAISAFFTEIGRLGHVLTWRLVVNSSSLLLGLIGISMLVTFRRPKD